MSVNSHIGLCFQGIDVVNGVLFACSDVNTTLVVGSKASLLGGALSWILDCCENLDVGLACVDEDLLGDVVEATRCENTPVEVA